MARWILRALVAVTLVIPVVALTPVPAHAETPGLVAVTITANTAPVLDLSDPEQVVALSGTIINTSADRIRFTTVEFWTSSVPITTEKELAEALASPATVPVGTRPKPWSEESGHTQVITREDNFAGGERSDFTVHSTVGELGFTTDDAAYLVGVQVRGIPDAGGKQVVGRGRILVAATSSPLRSSQIVKLAAGPHRTTDGSFVDDPLSGPPAKDLDALLTLAEESDATVLLDPMLLMDARALAIKHTVDGREAPPNKAAASWAARVDALISKGLVMRLPWSDVDIPRAAAMGRLTDAVHWADDALTDPALRSLPLAADLGAFASPELVKELGQLGFTVAVANNASSGSIGAVRVVQISDPNREGMGPGGSNTGAQHSGRRVAEELLAATPITYLARRAEDANSADILPQREVVPIVPDDAASTFTTAGEVPRWNSLSERISDLMSNASFRRDLTGADELPLLERVATVALSSSFETEEAAQDWLAANQPAEVNPSKVTISAASQFVMGSRTNNFPVTITNDLELPVTLRLVFDSESPQRITVPATDFETLQPGENLTLTLSPQASSNSIVTVRGHMETVGGTQFGRPVTIEITATELGRVGWIIIIISGAVVLGGTVWRIRAVQAERSKEHA